MGSPAVAAWITHGAFWVLLARGSFVAVLDIALVFVIFKGDVRIT